MNIIPFHIEMGGRPTPGAPRCCDCGRTADEIPGMRALAADENKSPVAIAREDGTYNREMNRFCCDACYIERGCPSSPGRRGWKAP